MLDDSDYIKEEFGKYVADNKIVELKDQELRSKWDRDELEAMKIIYTYSKIPSNKTIKELADRQIIENRNMVFDITSWKVGYCLLSNKPK